MDELSEYDRARAREVLAEIAERVATVDAEWLQIRWCVSALLRHLHVEREELEQLEEELPF